MVEKLKKGFIFSSPDAVRRKFRNYCKKMNISYYNPHSFRHTWASNMINVNKMPITEVKSILGHKSIATTNTYAHPNKKFEIEQLYQCYFGF